MYSMCMHNTVYSEHWDQLFSLMEGVPLFRGSLCIGSIYGLVPWKMSLIG